ncbi:unnamed protein product, partial [Bubo scandiacus]
RKAKRAPAGSQLGNENSGASSVFPWLLEDRRPCPTAVLGLAPTTSSSSTLWAGFTFPNHPCLCGTLPGMPHSFTLQSTSLDPRHTAKMIPVPVDFQMQIGRFELPAWSRLSSFL